MHIAHAWGGGPEGPPQIESVALGGALPGAADAAGLDREHRQVAVLLLEDALAARPAEPALGHAGGDHGRERVERVGRVEGIGCVQRVRDPLRVAGGFCRGRVGRVAGVAGVHRVDGGCCVGRIARLRGVGRRVGSDRGVLRARVARAVRSDRAVGAVRSVAGGGAVGGRLDASVAAPLDELREGSIPSTPRHAASVHASAASARTARAPFKTPLRAPARWLRRRPA